jgi:hypothetical protein
LCQVEQIEEERKSRAQSEAKGAEKEKVYSFSSVKRAFEINKKKMPYLSSCEL